jgi:hypothetical protein
MGGRVLLELQDLIERVLPMSIVDNERLARDWNFLFRTFVPLWCVFEEQDVITL